MSKTLLACKHQHYHTHMWDPSLNSCFPLLIMSSFHLLTEGQIFSLFVIPEICLISHLLQCSRSGLLYWLCIYYIYIHTHSKQKIDRQIDLQYNSTIQQNISLYCIYLFIEIDFKESAHAVVRPTSPKCGGQTGGLQTQRRAGTTDGI